MDLNYNFKKWIPPFSSPLLLFWLAPILFWVLFFNSNTSNTLLIGLCLQPLPMPAQIYKQRLSHVFPLPGNFQNKMQTYCPAGRDSRICCTLASLATQPNVHLPCFSTSHTSPHAPLPQRFFTPRILFMLSPAPSIFLLKSLQQCLKGHSLENCMLSHSVAVPGLCTC